MLGSLDTEQMSTVTSSDISCLTAVTLSAVHLTVKGTVLAMTWRPFFGSATTTQGTITEAAAPCSLCLSPELR